MNEKGPHLTLSDLETMGTHEFAELLSNLALILKRLPDVPLAALQPAEKNFEAETLVAKMRHEEKQKRPASNDLPDWAS